MHTRLIILTVFTINLFGNASGLICFVCSELVSSDSRAVQPCPLPDSDPELWSGYDNLTSTNDVCALGYSKTTGKVYYQQGLTAAACQDQQFQNRIKSQIDNGDVICCDLDGCNWNATAANADAVNLKIKFKFKFKKPAKKGGSGGGICRGRCRFYVTVSVLGAVLFAVTYGACFVAIYVCIKYRKFKKNGNGDPEAKRNFRQYFFREPPKPPKFVAKKDGSTNTEDKFDQPDSVVQPKPVTSPTSKRDSYTDTHDEKSTQSDFEALDMKDAFTESQSNATTQTQSRNLETTDFSAQTMSFQSDETTQTSRPKVESSSTQTDERLLRNKKSVLTQTKEDEGLEPWNNVGKEWNHVEKVDNANPFRFVRSAWNR